MESDVKEMDKKLYRVVRKRKLCKSQDKSRRYESGFAVY